MAETTPNSKPNSDEFILLPLTPVQGLDSEEVLLYRYSTIGSKDSIKLDCIESDDEYNDVADVFNELVADYENKISNK